MVVGAGSGDARGRSGPAVRGSGPRALGLLGAVEQGDEVAGACDELVPVSGEGLQVAVGIDDEHQRQHVLGLGAGALAQRVPALARGEAHARERLHQRRGRVHELARELG